MPLVERFTDWMGVPTGPHDDPRTLAFDHRIEATPADIKPLITNGEVSNNVLNNIKATCLITAFDSGYGWNQVGADWVYKPGAPSATFINCLGRQYDQEIAAGVQSAQKVTIQAFTDSKTPAKDLTTDIAGQAILDKVRKLVWPPDGSKPLGGLSTFESRFDLSKQYFAGQEFGTGYHLGNGYVGTAGHCIVKELLDRRLHTLKVVFGWNGDVDGKVFSKFEVFDVESVSFCDAPGSYDAGGPDVKVSQWARRWDNAIFKLKGNAADFSTLATVAMAIEPPKFGAPIYNVGAALGTALKLSPKGHVLRHALFEGTEFPFDHTVSGYGTYTTDLDQFGGNSGGPVFDRTTGEVVGHTASTQDEPGGANMAEMHRWEDEFLSSSDNYKSCHEINAYLEKKIPGDVYWRVYPKWLRLLSGAPMVANATHICPGDWGPNKPPHTAVAPPTQPPGKYQAVFSRHRFESRDVYYRNVTGRVERNKVFMMSHADIVKTYAGFSVEVKLVGPNTFTQPVGANSTLVLAIGAYFLPIDVKTLTKDHKSTASQNIYTTTMDLIAQKHLIPPSTGPGFLAWDKVRLEQRIDNPPTYIGINFTVHRRDFKFPADASWPPGQPAVTGDADITWPVEEFHFATTVGDSGGKLRTDAVAGIPVTKEKTGDLWHWIADFDRVWTNPRQPSDNLLPSNLPATLLDPGMSNIDPKMA